LAEQNLSTPGLVFVEVDEDATAYDTAHIRGTVKINWKTELQDPVRRHFVDRPGFEKLLSAKGISNNDTVVLYGGNNNWFAAYAYWYLKLYGHQNVKLIDGGRKKWELDGRVLVTEVPDRVEIQYVAKDQDLTISDDDAIAAYRTFSSLLLGHLLLEVPTQAVYTEPVHQHPQHQDAVADLARYPFLKMLEPTLAENHATERFNAALRLLIEQHRSGSLSAQDVVPQ